jgi:hypothetical protein
MKTRLRTLLCVLCLLCIITPLFSGSAFAFNAFQGICNDKNGSGENKSAVCNGQTSSDPLVGSNGILVDATHIVALAAGVIAILIIMISGLRYITSNGDANSVKGAKDAIIYASIGIVVIIVAQSLIAFVLDRI